MAMTVEMANRLYRQVGTGTTVVLYLPEGHILKGKLSGHSCEEDDNVFELAAAYGSWRLEGKSYIRQSDIVAYTIVPKEA